MRTYSYAFEDTDGDIVQTGTVRAESIVQAAERLAQEANEDWENTRVTEIIEDV